MKRLLWQAPAIALLGLAMLIPSTASAQFRGGWGGGGWGGPRVVVGGGWGGGWGYPYYGGWYGPGWGYDGYYGAPNAGRLKIKTQNTNKNSEVYIDGGYMGIAKKVKDVNLRPGIHNVELRAPNGGAIIYQVKVNIALGHTTEINPT